MPEKVMPGPVQDSACIREAVCIHTKKIFDSCRDKDCIEDLRFYPTQSSQCAIDRAVSIRAGQAELLYVYIDVEPIGFNRGFFTVDVRYFYRVTADAFVGAARPVQVCGLCVFDKRVILFGSEGSAKVFSSEAALGAMDEQNIMKTNLPTAVVEAVDPIVLNMKLVDVCDCRPCCDCELSEIRPASAPASAATCASATTASECMSPWASSPSSAWSGTPSCSCPPTTTACPRRSAPAAAARMTPARSSVTSSSPWMSSSRPTAAWAAAAATALTGTAATATARSLSSFRRQGLPELSALSPLRSGSAACGPAPFFVPAPPGSRRQETGFIQIQPHSVRIS